MLFLKESLFRLWCAIDQQPLVRLAKTRFRAPKLKHFQYNCIKSRIIECAIPPQQPYK